MNADLPIFDCWLRAEYLYDLRSHFGELERVTVFGLSSLQGRALGFHVLVHDTGAVIWRLPINALVHRETAPFIPLDHLQLWDCFSYQVHVHEFGHLSGRRCQAVLKNKKKYDGQYLFTVDWYGNNESENAGDSGHKCAHILELDCGVYAAQPNNRILWADPAVITKPFEKRPDYKTNTRIWQCEHETKWVTEDSDQMFYEVESK